MAPAAWEAEYELCSDVFTLDSRAGLRMIVRNDSGLENQVIQNKAYVRIPYRLGFSPQPQKNILVSHSRINPAPWKYLIYTNPAQGFLPDRLQNTPKIPVFQSRTPKINRYFSCAQSPRRAKNDIFARWYKVCTVYSVHPVSSKKTRVAQFGVWSKVWVCEHSCMLANL
jgi:hypothetical protein